MIVLSNSIAQVLAPGQSATFDTVVLHTGCAECHRKNTGSVNLVASNGIYDVEFCGNIGATDEGAAQLAITLDGSALLETTMISQTTAGGDLNNVNGRTFVRTCCCMNGEAITVTNTGTTTVNIGANPNLSVKRVA